ncbi:MAG: SpoIIE family protein phosphatase [Clostridia bacterium]|nr:SpoIIE family protein phosphatase [Clostridia bacterium]
MRAKGTIHFPSLFLHLAFGLGIFFLYYVGNNGEPFGLALAYAMASANLSPAVAAVFYFVSALPTWNADAILLALVQALLLAGGFYIQRIFSHKEFFRLGILGTLCLSLSLCGFIIFAPFTPYPTPFNLPFRLGTYPQKIIFAALAFLLSTMFSVSLKALLHKLLKCRLQNDELLFSLLLCTLVGMGICRFLSVNAYMGISFFVLLLFACATKDSSTLLCAFTLSLPPAFIAHLSPTRFFVYGVVIALFIKSGRLAAACATLIAFFAFGYFDGLYAYPTALLVRSILSAVLPCLFFVLIPTPLIRALENKLIFYREKHLSRIAINRNRALIGEKLFEISSVFREIEATFSALGTTEAEQGAKEYICGCIVEEVCKHCNEYRTCMRKGTHFALDRLLDVACLKGRITLIDLPRAFSDHCFNQSAIIHAVNCHIADYQKYMTETENAASGRTLLANQAQGVSEILKNLAVEQSEPLRIYTDKEHALNVALLSAGIVCSEVLIYGDEDSITLSLITFGSVNAKRIALIASRLFEIPMVISEKITLSNDKFCCILRKRPHFDAAFGVASTKKFGQTASGDTHSVIKIDERRFMVALSDGMGSGEYARRISESTITLLESFYRAKMPSDLVLSTINKLLTFSKEETFACVDIAVIDLDNGAADVVKIGSPLGFILSENTLKVLEGSGLPLGILDSLHPDTAAYTLSENDVLLFLSDGITDAFGSTADLYEVLKKLPSNNPQQLVDALLQQAIAAYGGTAKDDMTALAVRLFKPLDAYDA